MNRGLRLFLATGVLVIGVTSAFWFRLPPTDVASSEMTASSLVLRDRIAISGPSETATKPPNVRLQTPSIPGQSLLARPFTLSSMEPDKPPPELARSYHDAFPIAPSRWGTSMRLGYQDDDRWQQPERLHTVVDGDTLRALAKHYLGSSDRYPEIYEANKNLLPSPEVLPLGVDLKIPSHERPIPNGRKRGSERFVSDPDWK